jgi:hypothetical protein
MVTRSKEGQQVWAEQSNVTHPVVRRSPSIYSLPPLGLSSIEQKDEEIGEVREDSLSQGKRLQLRDSTSNSVKEAKSDQI